jgi:hypothetical protein
VVITILKPQKGSKKIKNPETPGIFKEKDGDKEAAAYSVPLSPFWLPLITFLQSAGQSRHFFKEIST